MLEPEAVIGLEVHVQLATRTKMFSGATCDFGRPPNSQVDALTLGLPGSLPVINDHAVDLAVTAALMLGGEIHSRSRFDRKHYFYPDLPKGYQISQYDAPYCTGGAVEIDLPTGGTRVIALDRIHLEEDAGKLVHQATGPWSEVDLNRAGTPLIEIVTAPVIASPAEAHAYLVELRRALRYAGVSDCEMQEGSLRCDANVSLRPAGSTTLGTKVEIKNLNSFRAVAAALTCEIAHQTARWQTGRYADEVVQETKLWDPDAQVTRSMRGKEGAADYRYFPDPDLPLLCISAERIARRRALLPERPRDREQRYRTAFALPAPVAAVLCAERATADYFETLVAAGIAPKAAANWTREEVLRRAGQERRPPAEAAPPAIMAALITLVEAGRVARIVAKGACDELFAAGEEPAAFFARRGMLQERDDTRLAAWVAAALAAEPRAAADVRGGKTAAIGRLVGCAMKLSGGAADPKAVREEIIRQLDAPPAGG
jgi:aspartyl-tRNA(Asn)/glutamyl-tRNA(Gln) amidotransferase subunit B